jgi:hypothetical protein
MQTEFDVFDPFSRNNKPAPVLIATYGISPPSNMGWVAESVPNGSRMIIGYSKKTHHPGVLRNVMSEWRKRGVIIRILPSFHAKIWIIEGRGYCGSANFVPSTLINYMHPAKAIRLEQVFDEYWRAAHDPFRRGTDYMRLPQTRDRIYFGDTT